MAEVGEPTQYGYAERLMLFGAGRRLSDVLPSRVEWEIVRVIDTPEATHIRYLVRR